MKVDIWDGTERDAGRLLAVEMEGAGSVAEATRAVDSWVMRVAIARERKLKGGSMRVNVYAEEMTEKVDLVSKVIDGQTFVGVRFYLELPVTTNHGQVAGPFLHRADDDDSSAVTFWGKQKLRAALQRALELLDAHEGGR